MPRTTFVELTALSAAIPDGVATISHLRRNGMTPRAIAARCRPGGPWRRLLPGVLLLGDGEPNRRQMLRAAAFYAGAGAVVTGLDALRAHNIRVVPSRQVQVLVPVQRRVPPLDFVSLERTSRIPEPVVDDDIAFAPPARATIDVARREMDPDRLRRLLSLPVYYGLCTADELRAELDAGNQRGTAAVREMLRNLGSMGDTYLQGQARELLDCVPLPPPVWNVTVCDSQGRPIGTVDAWWDEVALGWQFGADDVANRAPKMNHLALSAAGVVLVQTSPDQLRANVKTIARELTSAFANAAKRRRPRVRALGMVPATV
ncbi:hypothetical protein [Amycolatopsis sp.]|uniref:hypothetical protein n=1 Tax=Amycolatopsis sp. TaxID=37632 RepID=UPI002C26E9DA|nr:hypothetical protein [Amycolatopsis sp.]HVV14434.1 hypothetical protein [Amycolatopsis sp.]